MKLSTKSTYGLRAMLNIAMEATGHAVSITDIADREGISISYLEQLLNTLRHRGLIESVRGPNGGYILSKDPGEITVREIVEALEGGIYPVHCVTLKSDSTGTCKRNRDCVPKTVWVKLANAIKECLESITLKDLCRQANRIDGYKAARRSV